MSWTGMAAGAADGLDTVLARHLQQQAAQRQDAALGETVRSNRAQEDYRTRQLGLQEQENVATQELTRQLRAQQAAAAAQQMQDRARDDARATLGLLPVGTQVSPDEYTRFITTAGAPAGLFTPVTQMLGDDASEPQVTGYTFKGTASAQHAQTQEEIAAMRAELARQGMLMGNALGQARESRLREWGPPSATVFDPTSPTRTTLVPRPDAMGRPAPEPPGQRTQITANESAVDQLQNLKGLRDQVVGQTGPVAGRLQEWGKRIPLVPTSKAWADYSAASTNVKNATVKAITGAQLSEPEAKRIMDQLPKPEDKPDVWQANYEQSLRNLQTLERIVGTAPGTPNAGTSTGPAPTTPKRTIQSGRFVVEEY